MSDRNAPSAGKTKIVQTKRRSMLPLWGAAAFWVIAGLFFPMYRWYHYLVIAAISAAVSLILLKAPPVVICTEVPVSTGDEELDRILSGIDETAAALSDAVSTDKNDEVAPDIERILFLLGRIGDELRAPVSDGVNSGISGARRLDSYYLPTIRKLSEKYVKLKELSSGTDIPNAENTLSELRRAFSMTAGAMEKLLDYMLGDDAVDISTDIDVLEAVFKRDGLN